MNDLEKAKKELELRKVETAKLEMEFRILERMDDIKRLEENIKVQDNRIEEINQELGR